MPRFHNYSTIREPRKPAAEHIFALDARTPSPTAAVAPQFSVFTVLRIRAPRIRAPRIRAPRIRAPRIRAPRICARAGKPM